MSLAVGPVVANRPPMLALAVPPAIRHSDELPCGAGLLVHSFDYAGYRPAGLGSAVGHRAAQRRINLRVCSRSRRFGHFI